MSKYSRPGVTVILTFMLTGFLSHGSFAVSITRQSSPFLVTAERYSAAVDPDGCLTNILVGGKPFLAPGVNISRGSYFFHNGPLKLPNVTQPNDHTLRAEGSLASIEYEFESNRMTWTLQNRNEERIVFFLVLDSGVSAMRDAAGSLQQAVFQGPGSKSTWFREHETLTIEGTDRFWGPWHDRQVVEVGLPPGESRTLSIVVGSASDKDRHELAALVTPEMEPDLLVRSPLNYQVFQRDTESSGTVRINGRVAGDIDRVEARISGTSPFGTLSTEWRPIDWYPAARQFQATHRYPAGGWYRLDLRALRGDDVVHQATVEHVGVGEVFVGAGQSNSTNCGQFKTRQTTGMVSSFGGDRWKLADDPQLGVADRSQGGSFWPAFGDQLHRKLDVPIGVATTGYGGTSVNQWQPEDNLFKWMMTRIGQLGPHGFRAVLWHQGESDVHMDAEDYYRKLANVIQQSKATAGWEFPWYVAHVSYHNPDNVRFESTRKHQSRLWMDGVALQGPDTDILTGDHRDLDGKGIHFSPKGLKAHGEMWAHVVLPYVEQTLQELESTTSE